MGEGYGVKKLTFFCYIMWTVDGPFDFPHGLTEWSKYQIPYSSTWGRVSTGSATFPISRRRGCSASNFGTSCLCPLRWPKTNKVDVTLTVKHLLQLKGRGTSAPIFGPQQTTTSYVIYSNQILQGDQTRWGVTF